MNWFRHDKFGMFIHFGPYSALAGEWNGQAIPPHTEAEWIMQRFNIPVAEYRERARQFNPTKFDATAIVALAKATGMKYLVVTAKHHDGFAMYKSALSNYNIVDWTPFHRDIVKELSDACQKAGIRFSVYYSHREDWDDPNGFGNNWDYDPAKKNFSQYLETKAKPQLKELLTNYGPLGLIWFDRGMDTPQHAPEFADLVHSIQPQCLINGRIGSYKQELMGDYQDMNDNGMPSGGLEEDWETPQTLNTTWGYSKFDQDWKTPGVVIRRLVEIVSKGGNYLLNIGPMPDGSVPAPSRRHSHRSRPLDEAQLRMHLRHHRQHPARIPLGPHHRQRQQAFISTSSVGPPTAPSASPASITASISAHLLTRSRSQTPRQRAGRWQLTHHRPRHHARYPRYRHRR